MTRRRRFSCRAESVTAARGFVRNALNGQAQEVIDAAELMACELATNCVQHARTGFELVIEDSQGEIRIEVSDAGDGRPTLRSPTPEESSGRGLRIVQAMSDAWGIVPDTNGKSVWFTLSHESDASSATSSRSASGHEQRGACAHRSASISGGDATHAGARRAPKARSRRGGHVWRNGCASPNQLR